jgi:uncharacterized protein YggL (DUF469 family)
MKKLTRKKRRIGEYTCWGYCFQMEFVVPINKDDWTFWDDFISWCEQRNFTCGGSSNSNFISIVLDTWESPRSHHVSPTPEERDSLVDWLKNRTEIKSITVSEKINLWHDNDLKEKKIEIEWQR